METHYDENISYNICETEEKKTCNIDTLLADFENITTENLNEFDLEEAQILKLSDYDTNYTVKQLTTIYEYYGLKKCARMKKLEMIFRIVEFEIDPSNIETVMRRKQMWFYIAELKNDPFMKRFLLGTL